VLKNIKLLISKMFYCKHCKNEIVSLDDTPKHTCFFEKSIYLENNNILFVIEEDDKGQ